MSLPKPYYEDSAVTIYHADCRAILPELPKVDLVLTDPFWGIEGSSGNMNRKRNKGGYDFEGGWKDDADHVKKICVPAFKKALSISKRGILTPGQKCERLYPKPDVIGGFWTPAAAGWTAWGHNLFTLIYYYGKDPRAGKAGVSGTGRCMNSSPDVEWHPCSKPLKEWSWLLNKGSLPGETVLDIFMGSGTTLLAAKSLGRKAIGVEISERYCELAARRMAQEILL